MKKVIIKNEVNGRSFGSKFEDDAEMQAWIDSCISKNSWGLPARKIWMDEATEAELARSKREEDEVVVDEPTGESRTLISIPCDYVITIVDLTQDPEWLLAECHRKRRAEYPDIAEYIDGVVKGDQEQVDAYIADCLAVKAKYPKP